MDKFIEKISSYNFLNFIIPGGLIIVLEKEFIGFVFLTENIFLDFCIIYFLGFLTSRIGSLIVEPILKGINYLVKKITKNKKSFLKREPYKNFIDAEKKDEKLKVLNENSNMYRSFCGGFVFLLFSFLYKFLSGFTWFENNSKLILLIVIFLLLVLAYIKQNNYVADRIKSDLELAEK